MGSVENINRQCQFQYQYDFCWEPLKSEICITEKSLACNMTKTELHLESSKTSIMDLFCHNS